MSSVTTRAPAVTQVPATGTVPTIWGCSPTQVHDRYWAASGIQVVRRHERSELVADAELFLLCDQQTLVLFSPGEIVDAMYWLDPRLLLLRVHDASPAAYREVAVTDRDRLVRFERVYRSRRGNWTRIALTPDRELALAWQNAPDARSPWRWIRSRVPGARQAVRRIEGQVYDERDPPQVMECVREVMRRWRRPDATIRRAKRTPDGAWADPSASVAGGARFRGPVWVGAGRRVGDEALVAGPAVLWDEPAARPRLDDVEWLDIDAPRMRPAAGRAPAARRAAVPGKRAFDIAIAATALAVTLPVFPIVAIAILLDDGGPVFFAHRRETVGGREFGCFKFRSMRKEADVARSRLARTNEADGPQFFIRDDPRVTRVGRFIRRFQIDELPQLLNVLLGHMSIVGPRPSPHSENQYCPAWREARLSVRPGLTGLWQVCRTRRQGLDFQEWIRFDLEYVERASWALDLSILWRTLRVVFAGLR